MNILVIIDHYGWAYHMQARGLQKHSKHQITIKACNDVKKKDIAGADIVHVWSWTNLPTVYNKVPLLKKRKIIAGSWSTIFPEDIYKKYMGPDYPPPNLKNVEAMIISDRRIYDKIMSGEINKPNIKFYFSPHQVDGDLFSPNHVEHEGYILGWVGDARRPDKRVELLDKLDYPVKVRSTNIPKYFRKNRSLEEIRDFYNSLDVYVFVSDATVEGGISLTILEAMACGLPVISTNHGSELKNILEPEWIIPCQPEDQVVKLVNEKLRLLEENPKLREKIGERNRKKALECSWKKVAKQYDRIYDQFGLRYVLIQEVKKKQMVEFLNGVRDRFINDQNDETLYFWGDWTIDGEDMILRPLERFGYACLDGDNVVAIVYFLRLGPQFGYGDRCVYPAGVTRKDYRGRGIGTKLYELSESLIRSLGMERISMAPRCDIKTGVTYNELSPIVFKYGTWKEVERQIIVSEPQALKLKKNEGWNKRKCVVIRYIKELKECL